MPFLEVNGVTVMVAKGTFSLRNERVDSREGRTLGGVWESTALTRKRAARGVRIVMQTPAHARAMHRLIEGDGISMRLDTDAFSFGGLGPNAGSSYTIAGSGGKHGGRATVGSAARLEYALPRLTMGSQWTPSSGWSVIVQKKLAPVDGADGVTWWDHCITGSVAFARGSDSNPAGTMQYRNGTQGNWSMGNWVGVDSSGNIGIHGKTNLDTNGSYDYDDLVILPYVLPSSWMSGIAAFRSSYPWSRLPFVTLRGAAIEEPGGIEARGMVQEINSLAGAGVSIDGVAYDQAVELVVDFLER